MKYLFSFLFSLFSFLVSSQSEWIEEESKEDIKAYSRIKEGKDYYEFRTVFEVNTSLITARKLISNISHFKNWLPSTLESKVLKVVSDSVLYAYTVTEAPWPASKRDLVFKVTKRKTGNNTYSIIMEGKPDFHPLQKDMIRVQEYNAIWKITKLNANLVKIDYSASFNPGSTYPNWIIKNSLVEARIQTSLNFIEEVKSDD
ncbi:MAG: START domain-containing protein [Brumimicrobium sp.]